MEKAKAAVSNFTSRAGHHDTTVQKQAGRPVTQETVKPTEHEEVNPALNKEVHQDHYRRVVQPVQDREVLPEQHSHRAADVVHREFDHRDKEGTERTLRAEAGKLRDQRQVTGTTYSQSQAPVVQGEQVHHHVHETVQPVIQKETVQPHVVHTTAPVHEVHHNATRHHGTTTMQPVSMDEFKKRGGTLGGSGQTERNESFEGCPKAFEESQGAGRGSQARSASSSPSSNEGRRASRRADRGTGEAVGSSNTSTRSEGRKPSLMDRLNPTTDADNDGKAGFMS